MKEEATSADIDIDDSDDTTLGEGSPQLTVFDLAGLDNIATILTDEKIRKIGQQVVDGYNADKRSRSHREDRLQAAMDLAMQITKKKDYPWDGCANVILPLITQASLHFAARAYPAVIKDGTVVKVKVIGSDEGVEQPILDLYNQPMTDDNGMPMTQVVGKGEKEKRGQRVADFQNWQFVEQMPNWVDDTDRLLNILPVAGNVFRKVYWSEGKIATGLIFQKNLIVDYFTTNLKTAPRITQEFPLYNYEITERIRSGRFIEVKLGDANSQDAKEVTPDAREEDSGDVNAPHLFIEQHLRLDMDDDGYPEPYIATVHVGESKLVRLVANYTADNIQANDKEIIKIIPEEYFVKYGFIPSPDGSFYDMGFGELLHPLNEAANSIVNRLLDAGTLASTATGFIGRGLKMKSGTISVSPGKFMPVDTKGGFIRDNVFQMQFPEPSPTLFKLLEMMIGMAKEIANSNEIMAGEAQSNMAGITVMQLVEQGLTGFKAIYKRVYQAISKEVKLIYRLNERNLPQDFYAKILDVPVDAKKDFANDFDIVPVADISMVTDIQKLAKAQAYEAYKGDPFVKQKELREKAFEAAGLDKSLVTDAPPPPADPAMELIKLQAQIEQQKAVIKDKELQIKAIKNEQETVLKANKLAVDTTKQIAEITKINSETAKNYAEAEATQPGEQLGQLLTLTEIQNDNQRGTTGVAG